MLHHYSVCAGFRDSRLISGDFKMLKNYGNVVYFPVLAYACFVHVWPFLFIVLG